MLNSALTEVAVRQREAEVQQRVEKVRIEREARSLVREQRTQVTAISRRSGWIAQRFAAGHDAAPIRNLGS